MTNKEFLISKLEETLISTNDHTIVQENDTEYQNEIQEVHPIVCFIQDDITEYHLIYEYNPTFADVVLGKYKSPFLIYECSTGEQFCITVKHHNGKPYLIDFVATDIITEKEEHERYNAVGIHVDATLMGINRNEPIESKIDTGAECCSLGVENITIHKSDVDPDAQKVKFTYNERQYTMKVAEMISVSSADGGIHYRPTVLFDIKVNGHLVPEVQVNLNDRSQMEYKFLIGMNLLEKCDLVIDPSITKEDVQVIHNMLIEQDTDKKDVIDPTFNKIEVTRRIIELMLVDPDVSFKDIISTIKLDAYNALDQLQA